MYALIAVSAAEARLIAVCSQRRKSMTRFCITDKQVYDYSLSDDVREDPNDVVVSRFGGLLSRHPSRRLQGYRKPPVGACCKTEDA